jgi:hypothetical protein
MDCAETYIRGIPISVLSRKLGGQPYSVQKMIMKAIIHAVIQRGFLRCGDNTGLPCPAQLTQSREWIHNGSVVRTIC